ncbi:M48 family metallopeptidase [Gilvimarinus sp. SDUM040013]|uniref:M48 family metallopeptidase n=1 Tax=Gilvimarinus gilvus TaxID=3058038 RepID=A0ABU4RSV4_9GAMM|nr:M48 family metallopeptidase [Gilvimarinus sp. SDUM040013]MDO3388407.1 M48 family metallopeptidase [Gilvimarinus sp. SDUM040013]MDX6847957.1 M48 family metallopeptidase [Gilvimarinus sp. SDUM040013]
MNFFEQQDIAKRNTRKLVALLLLAILSLVAVTTALFVAVTYYLQTGNSVFVMETAGMNFWQKVGTLINWETIAGIGLIVITVVILGGLYKYLQLGRGGSAVAEALGGRLINQDSTDGAERRLLNIVEEMAIASGTPVPPVYVLEESAINAFAAGHTPQDAVIGVTRGCIETLNRSELQGVIAHEFSHIFHGDMRLNMRLVALLNGILLLGLIGQYMLRGSMYRSVGRSSKDNSQGAIMGAGLALMVIGYAGTFFGSLIKAAVSRQREFLADASAVQFTRDNQGIAGALKKIGSVPSGSKLEAQHSAEFSHMYFGQGVSTAFNSLMATHPPLSERIKRVQPDWDGEFPAATHTATAEAAPAEATSHSSTHSAHAGFSADPAAAFHTAQMAAAVDHIGQPNTEDIAQARSTMASIPKPLYVAAHDGYSARAVIFGLLLDQDNAIRVQQWRALTQHYANAELNDFADTAKSACRLATHLRLPLIELCLPALKTLSDSQLSDFLAAMDTLIAADQQTNVMEWAVRRITRHHLGLISHKSGSLNLRQLREECSVLLSFMCHAGSQEHSECTRAFKEASDVLRLSELPLVPLQQLETQTLDRALEKLNKVKPLQKPLLLKAMMRAIEADGVISIAEAELFRAIADSLNCPVPPLRDDLTRERT